MPKLGGIEAMAVIRSRYPSARIIVLTTYDTEQLATKAIAQGARAYLLKSSARRDLINTIRSVHSGKKHVDEDVAATIASYADNDLLTNREVDVLRLIAAGNSNREIGAQLSIAEETVKGHVKNILAKLSANDRAHAVAVGLKRGIIGL
jgi:two-component system NarL family response regulator